MANLTSTINVNVPSDIKEKANQLFETLGLNMSTAINMFLRKSIDEWAIPFNVSVRKPNKELLEALQEGEDILNDKIQSRGYHNVDKMVEDIINDSDWYKIWD